MNIFVTGAAGFIAHRTCEMLLDMGHNVIGIDNLNDYYDVTLKDFRVDLLKEHENFTFYHNDIENFEILEYIFNKHDIDVVMNLAARAGVRYSIINPYVYFTTNTKGSLNILELMKKHKVKKYILASTSSLYAGQEMPFVETLPVNTPISPYAATKKSAEVMAYTYHHLFDIDVSVLRYFTVYGPYSRPDMAILRFMKWIDEGQEIQLYGDGSQSRDFTYVDDVAIANIKAMKNVGYEIINVGGGKNPISINYVISKMEEHLGKKAIIKNLEFNKADMVSTWANIDKAKKILEWEPRVSFEEGIEKTINVFKEKDIFRKIKIE